jgi:hypothetical protein
MTKLTKTRSTATAGVLLALLTPCFAQEHTKPSLDRSERWLLSYVNQNATGNAGVALQNAPRFKSLLQRDLPQQALFLPGNRSVGNAILDFIGDAPVVLRDRYLTVDGCVRHICPDLSGYLWIDALSPRNNLYFAVLEAIPGEGIGPKSPSLFHLWIFQNAPLRKDFLFAEDESPPDEFLYAFQDWFDKPRGRNIVSVTLVGSDGKMKPLLPVKLHLSGVSGLEHPERTTHSEEQQ